MEALVTKDVLMKARTTSLGKKRRNTTKIAFFKKEEGNLM